MLLASVALLRPLLGEVIAAGRDDRIDRRDHHRAFPVKAVYDGQKNAVDKRELRNPTGGRHGGHISETT